MKHSLPLLLLLTAILGASSTSAATVAYWRFGDDTSFTHDSSGNSNTLSPNGSPTQITLPATGQGSDFSNPIPQTGAGNTQAFDRDDTYFSVDSSFIRNAANRTYEAYFDFDSTSGDTQYLLGSWSFGSQRSFAFGVDRNSSPAAGTNNGLFMLVSDNGNSTSAVLGSGIALTSDTDYYVGVTFDGTTDTNDVTVYLKNLTNNTALQTVVLSSGITTLHAGTDPFHVGNYVGTSAGPGMNGIIDEVRISDSILSQAELLVSVPEPSHFGLALGVVLVGLTCLRRQRT